MRKTAGEYERRLLKGLSQVMQVLEGHGKDSDFGPRTVGSH